MSSLEQLKNQTIRCRKPCCNECKEDHENSTIFGNDEEWLLVKNRIIQVCTNYDKYACDLALALGKYHYYTGPEDWDPKFGAEKMICRCTDLIIADIENGNYEKEDVAKLIEEYQIGLIPDAFIFFYDFND